MKIEFEHHGTIHLHVHDSNERAILEEILQRVIHTQKDVKEIKNTMPTIQDVKTAVLTAAAQVQAAIQDSIAKETTEITAQIQALKDQIGTGTPVTQADLDEIVASVTGIGQAAATAIDTISTADGAVPLPPPPPPLP